MTRARNKLFLFSSDKNNPSRYLKEIDSDLLENISTFKHDDVELIEWWDSLDSYTLKKGTEEYYTNWKFVLLCNYDKRDPWNEDTVDVNVNEIREILNLTKINAGNGDIMEFQIFYLTPLLKFYNIRELNLRRCHVVDFSPLSQLKSLKKLVLDHNEMNTLEFLDDISLEELYIDECPNLSTKEIDRYKNINENCKIYHKYDRYDMNTNNHIYVEYKNDIDLPF